jgi:pseudoazurin
MRLGPLLAAATLAGASVSTAASGKEYQVAMVNRSADGPMAFAPGYLRIKPGDTVRFVAKDKGHNAESMAHMIPAGAPPFKGRINEELVVRFTRPGVFGYKCLPHLGMGMVGVIQVGEAGNLADLSARAAKLPPLAARRMAQYLKQAR